MAAPIRWRVRDTQLCAGSHLIYVLSWRWFRRYTMFLAHGNHNRRELAVVRRQVKCHNYSNRRSPLCLYMYNRKDPHSR